MRCFFFFTPFLQERPDHIHIVTHIYHSEQPLHSEADYIT